MLLSVVCSVDWFLPPLSGPSSALNRDIIRSAVSVRCEISNSSPSRLVPVTTRLIFQNLFVLVSKVCHVTRGKGKRDLASRFESTEFTALR